MGAPSPESAGSPIPCPLSNEEVCKAARLARLEPDPATHNRIGEELGTILGYFQRLQAMDLEGVEPLSHPLDARNRLDDDTPHSGLSNEVLMALAPESEPPFVKVPRVLPGQSGA